MNRTANLFVLLIVISFILPATAIRYAHAATKNSQENNNTVNGQESSSSSTENSQSNNTGNEQQESKNAGNTQQNNNANQASAATPRSLTVGTPSDEEYPASIIGKLSCGGIEKPGATIHLTLHHITTGRTTTASTQTVADGSYEKGAVLGHGHSYTVTANFDGDSDNQPASATASINIKPDKPLATGSTQESNNAGNVTSTGSPANATSTGAAISLSGHTTTSNNTEQSSNTKSSLRCDLLTQCGQERVSSGFTQLFKTWHSPQGDRFLLQEAYGVGYDAGYTGKIDSCSDFQPWAVPAETRGYCHQGFVAGQHYNETDKTH
jgi:hypothetical protein